MGRIAGLAFALAAAGSAAAADGQGPVWSQAPSWKEVQAAFPTKAKANAGSVVLRCSVGPTGTLSGCANGGEKPAGEGFYEAALSLAPRFVMEAPPAAGGEVDLPFSFTRPGGKDGRSLTSPKWVHAMSIAEQQSLYPAAAPASTKQGAAIIRCEITAKGQLSPCKVMDEAPLKQGFGDAALETARRLTMNPWSEAGYPYEGLTLTFRLSFAREWGTSAGR